ncbi:hypothetical protein [Enterocloster phage PMBT24]|uniref:Uncharacterized protein n=1 Tax=Enterocloster phage PMBT24 TaxID=3025413 RepID=A0AAT9TT89_9CAUD|nr:hypothetical protein [Enterocloster phage PMBT24]
MVIKFLLSRSILFASCYKLVKSVSSHFTYALDILSIFTIKWLELAYNALYGMLT